MGQSFQTIQFMKDAQALIEMLAEQTGVKCSVQLDFNKGMLRMTTSDEDADKAEFEFYASKFGYPKDWWQRTFLAFNGFRYRITGVRKTANAHQGNCLNIVRLTSKGENGKGYICKVNFVHQGTMDPVSKRVVA